jgi:hypothetical protein
MLSLTSFRDIPVEEISRNSALGCEASANAVSLSMITWTCCSFSLGTNAERLVSVKYERIPFDTHVLDLAILVLERVQNSLNDFVTVVIVKCNSTLWICELVCKIASSHESKVGVYAR